MEHTICWDCKKATGRCSWSEKLEPVKGWNAEPTVRHEFHEREMRSFLVRACPEFEADARGGGTEWIDKDGHPEIDVRHRKKKRGVPGGPGDLHRGAALEHFALRRLADAEEGEGGGGRPEGGRRDGAV